MEEKVPSELSLAEIRNYMVQHGCKVTNHALVKYFKPFLTDPRTQNEARKQFKTFVNILATIKTENNQKYLVLRKKYLNECPTEENVPDDDKGGTSPEIPMSPGASSISSDFYNSPGNRQPPPYKPPPQVAAGAKLPVLEKETSHNYRDCVNEFQAAMNRLEMNRCRQGVALEDDQLPPALSSPSTDLTQICRTSIENDNSSRNEDNKENVAITLTNTNAQKRNTQEDQSDKRNCEKIDSPDNDERENSFSVKETARKFNRMASEEEAKAAATPSPKKKDDQKQQHNKICKDDKSTIEPTLAHPKSKEWIVAAAKASYHELAKLASQYPELVKLQDPANTALHWAAKHGNEDVIKLIAGTYKANINARTNGGYTPLHIAMQFGRDNVFELLCNVYKANRDITDWSGNKPLDYRKQRTTISASTYSKIKAKKKAPEKDLGFLRIGSLNVRVKKTTEAFSNFLGVGSGNTNTTSAMGHGVNPHRHRLHRNHHHSSTKTTGMDGTGVKKMTSTLSDGKVTTQQPSSSTRMSQVAARKTMMNRASVQPTKNNQFDILRKSWGSADNIPHDPGKMPPPVGVNKSKQQLQSADDISDSGSGDLAGYYSMPATPNQSRAPIGILSESPQTESAVESDSDSACGFGSSWSVTRRNFDPGNEDVFKKPPTYL